MKKIDLTQFDPCEEGLDYYNSKSSFEEAWRDCERGDWMLWIAQKLGIDDRLLTRAKALCANTVRRLMTDRRSTAAVDAALRYANGEISRNELGGYGYVAAVYAVTNADATKDKVAYYAAYAADSVTCVYTVSVARAAAEAAANATRAAAEAANVANTTRAASEARTANRRQTAAICREVLTDAVFEKINQLQTNQQ